MIVSSLLIALVLSGPKIDLQGIATFSVPEGSQIQKLSSPMPASGQLALLRATERDRLTCGYRLLDRASADLGTLETLLAQQPGQDALPIPKNLADCFNAGAERITFAGIRRVHVNGASGIMATEKWTGHAATAVWFVLERKIVQVEIGSYGEMHEKDLTPIACSVEVMKVLQSWRWNPEARPARR